MSDKTDRPWYVEGMRLFTFGYGTLVYATHALGRVPFDVAVVSLLMVISGLLLLDD